MATKSYGDRPNYRALVQAKIQEIDNRGLSNEEAAEALKTTAVGVPESAVTMGTNILSMIPAGITGMMTATTPEDKRPKGIRMNGQWYPSLVGEEPITPGEATENIMNRYTYQPRTERGQRVLQGLGNAMNEAGEIMMPIREGYMSGANALGVAPAVAALPWVGAQMAAEVTPVGRGRGTAARAGSYARRADEIAANVGIDEDLLRFAEQYDPNLTMAINAADMGQPLPPVDPSLPQYANRPKTNVLNEDAR